MPVNDVPTAWWQQTCEVINHPVACVGTDNRIVWANLAFQRLTGYSASELRQMTWMDFTVHEDVGGDLASVRDVVEGKLSQYTISKTYRHKRGSNVPVELTVWRFPPGVGELTCFIAESVPESATVQQLDEFRSELQKTVAQLSHRILMMESDRGDIQTVNVGNNSTDVFKWVVVALLSVVAAVSYLTYIAGWPHHRGQAEPPNPVQVNDGQ